MSLDIENGAVGAEYEENENVVFFLQNITDSTVYRNWIQNITSKLELGCRENFSI